MERILNNLYARIIISLLVGIPLSAIALIGGAHGLVLGIAGIKDLHFGLALIGIVTIIGIIGAWRRLLEPTDSMASSKQNNIRLMLILGLAASLSLTVWSVIVDGISIIAVSLLTLSTGGFVFVLATPKKL